VKRTKRFAIAAAFGVALSTGLSSCSGGGGSTPTPTPAPTATAQPLGQASAARLLTQATFGPTYDMVTAASTQTYDQWFTAQAAAAPSLTSPLVAANANGGWTQYWWRNAVLGPDQLRQRMAFALSEIFVVQGLPDSATGVPANLAAYYDILVNDSLGNYRKLLEDVTLSPEMGLFLNMFRNDRPDPARGRHADENYAREVMQLFSVGLVRLNADGSVQTDSSGNPVPTYSQAEVEGLARVFTGWASQPTDHTGDQAFQFDQDYVHQMVAYENHHDPDAKTILGGTQVPAGGTAAADLKIALDAIFNHPNVGPFLSRQLIQRLVTSNPSPAYVQRVATIFNNNGQGVRGDLLAVARAILTDPEAVASGGNNYGKLREPIVRMAHLWRAFNATDQNGALNEFLIVNQSSEIFSQSPLMAPSVFNFFVPDYVRAGPLATAGLVAPEFQITNENSSILTANRLERQAYQFVDSTGTIYFSPSGFSEVSSLNSSSVLLRTNQWEPLADDPAALIDRLSLVLMQGQMPAAMRTTLINYVAAIPTSTAGYRGYRAIEAASLIINSPQYSVQR
jgi:uncharacterized protein (DUF1800 family)